jgi:hypothetical protein
VIRLLESPRRRRRLIWGGALVLVAAAVAGVVAVFPSPDKPPEARGVGWSPPKEEKQAKLSHHNVAAGLKVADRFVRTAVARRHTEDSWTLVVPSMRSGYTQEEWAKGDIPVVPYPVGGARWRIAYEYPSSLGLEVALFPPKNQRRKTKAAVFNVDLRAVGTGDGRHWLVENFTPAVTRSVPMGSPRASGVPNLSPEDDATTRLGAVWLLVPFGVLGLAILVPVIIGVIHWRRARQAERDWAARPHVS